VTKGKWETPVECEQGTQSSVPRRKRGGGAGRKGGNRTPLGPGEVKPVLTLSPHDETGVGGTEKGGCYKVSSRAKKGGNDDAQLGL